MGILKHHAQGVPQVGLFDFVDVDAVIADLSVCDVIETVDQIGDGGFSGSGTSHKGDLLARRGVQPDVVQNDFVRIIAKIHIVEGHVSGQLRVGDGALRLMGMPPGPQAGALWGFRQASVRIFFCVDQLHIAVVFLRRFVQQVEDPLRAGHCHDDAVGLLADLADGLGGVFIQGQEGNQGAQGQAQIAVQSEKGSHYGAEHIADIAQVAVDRHGDVGENVGLFRTVPKLFIQHAELLQALLFVAEHLDHLLSVHHFLDVAVDRAQIPLLSGEIHGRFSRDAGGDQEHEADHGQGDQGKGKIQKEHADKGGHNGHGGVDELRNALAYELAQGVHVIGVDGHDIAMGMGVKIPDGKRFHVFKQFDAQRAHGSLAHVDHDPVVGVGAQDADGVDAAHPKKRSGQGREVRLFHLCQRNNVVVDQALHEKRALKRRQGGADNAEDDQEKRKFIVLQHVSEHPAHGFAQLSVIGFPAGGSL